MILKIGKNGEGYCERKMVCDSVGRIMIDVNCLLPISFFELGKIDAK